MNGLAFVAPWALAGLALVALPIAIHLMGRTPARPFRFPSLRFVTPSQVLPRRRAQIEDPFLLVLRVLAIVAAAVALAAPAFRGTTAVGAAGTLATVVIVDTSVSVTGSGTERPARVAQLDRVADSALAAAQVGIVLRTTTPARELAGAASWLARHDAQREIVIVSDFQVGALDSVSLAGLPPGTAVRFRRVASRVPTSVVTVQGGAGLEASVVALPGGIEATWTRRGAAARDSGMQILAGESDRALIAALLEASRTSGVGAAAPGNGPIGVVLPSEPTRAVLESSAQPMSAGWQRRVAAALAADQALFATASADRPPFTAAASRDGAMLLIFAPPTADAASALTLVTAVRRAASAAPAGSELAVGSVDDATLARWNASRAASPTSTTTSVLPVVHGPATRWLWIAALVLLAVEWFFRRGARPTTR